MVRRLWLGIMLSLVVLATTTVALVIPSWTAVVVAAGTTGALLLIGSEVLRGLGKLRSPPRSVMHVIQETSPATDRRPADLAWFERSLGWGSYAPEESEHRLKPLFFRLARHRILVLRRVDIGRDERLRSETLTGPLEWLRPEITRKDVVKTDEIEVMLDRIEGLT